MPGDQIGDHPCCLPALRFSSLNRSRKQAKTFSKSVYQAGHLINQVFRSNLEQPADMPCDKLLKVDRLLLQQIVADT